MVLAESKLNFGRVVSGGWGGRGAWGFESLTAGFFYEKSDKNVFHSFPLDSSSDT